MAAISSAKRRYFRNQLALKLYRCRGEAFQRFASEVLARVHGDNFLPTIPVGPHGDLKCDGCLREPRTIFACYGPLGGGSYLGDELNSVLAKIRSDFEGAVANWPRLEHWVFVSSFVEGVPSQIIQVPDDLETTHGVKVSYFGQDMFETQLLAMDEDVVEDPCGEIATREDFVNLHPEVVREVVDAVANEFLAYLDEKTAEVPANKIAINKIPNATPPSSFRVWRDVQSWKITCSTTQTHYSRRACLPLSVTATWSCAHRALESGDIVDRLLEFGMAGHHGGTQRLAAGWAVLSYLFEKCANFLRTSLGRMLHDLTRETHTRGPQPRRGGRRNTSGARPPADGLRALGGSTAERAARRRVT